MKTRNERRRDRLFAVALTVVWAALLTIIVFLLLAYCEHQRVAKRLEAYAKQPPVLCTVSPVEVAEESAIEPEDIEAAVLATVGTEYETESFGYCFTDLLKIITAEGGEDYDTCWYVATCLLTAQMKTGLRFTPVEVAEMQQFARPAEAYTHEAYLACVEVFLRGNRAPEVEDATVFHCLGRGNTNYHDGELCEWVTEHNGVDYYVELKNWDEEVARWRSRSE